MADATYFPKIYKKDGGDTQIIAFGGVLDVESGGALKLAGTQVTATAAEINKLASLATTAAELDALNGRTATFTVLASATLAEINAGKTLLADDAAYTLSPVGFRAVVAGTFADATAIVLKDTSGTVTLATIAIAAAADGAVLGPETANVTMGAGFLAALTAGEGIAVSKTGSTATGGTSIVFAIDYIVTAV